MSSPAVCIFCDIVAGREAASPVYADDLVLAFLDNAPINPGHTLVIPKAHYVSLSELPEATGARIFAVGRHVVGAIRQSGIRCEGVNLFVSDGEAAGQEVFHCHLHVLPRFQGDAFRVEHGPSVRPSREELEGVAQRLSVAYGETSPGNGPSPE